MPNAAGNSVIAVSILVTALEAVGNSVRRIAARTAALGAQRKLIDVLVGFRFCPKSDLPDTVGRRAVAGVLSGLRDREPGARKMHGDLADGGVATLDDDFIDA